MHADIRAGEEFERYRVETGGEREGLLAADPRGGGLDGLLDDCVDLDDLVDVAEQCDAEECRGWGVVLEPSGHFTPGVEQVLVGTNDVDRELVDIGAREAVMRNQREQVVEALACLSNRIAGPDNIRSGIAWNLAGNEEPSTDLIGISVVGRLCQSSAQLAFVHSSGRPSCDGRRATTISATPRMANSASPPRLIATSLSSSPS